MSSMNHRSSGQSLEPMLTIEQVAQRIGCSTKTVRRRIAAGDVVAVKMVKLVRISERDLASYLNRNRMSG
jgi:excisionase family DNA binding protein